MVDIKAAAGAYTDALDKVQKGMTLDNNDKTAGEVTGPSFGDVLKESVEGAIAAQHKSEKVSAAAVTGQANITDVLQAVTEAEMTLNTVVSVRDRVIRAYEEIMRSPI